jgi:hypothetical protein
MRAQQIRNLIQTNLTHCGMGWERFCLHVCFLSQPPYFTFSKHGEYYYWQGEGEGLIDVISSVRYR